MLSKCAVDPYWRDVGRWIERVRAEEISYDEKNNPEEPKMKVKGTKKGQMKHPKIVSSKEWEAARHKLLVKEKKLTRARDSLAAERRRMPWLPVEKEYEFDGPRGKASLL